MSVPAHMFFGAIWGYALGARLVEKRLTRLALPRSPPRRHGAFDALLSIDGGGIARGHPQRRAGDASSSSSCGDRSATASSTKAVPRHPTRGAAPLPRRAARRSSAVSSIALHVLAFGILVLGGLYQTRAASARARLRRRLERDARACSRSPRSASRRRCRSTSQSTTTA